MPEPRVVQAGVLSRPRVQALALIGAAAVGVYVCYLLVQPFIPALTWGLALAVVGWPIHKVVRAHVHQRTIAAGLTVTVVALVVVAPVVFVSQQLLKQALRTVEVAREALQGGRWRDAIDNSPQLAALLAWVETAVPVEDVTARLGTYAEGLGRAVVVGSLAVTVQLLITVLVLFYFFRDKRDLAGEVRAFVPMSDREADALIQRVTDTIQATIFGSLAVAVVQGSMGGLMFWILGLPAPVLWGAVMAVLATIPVAGTFVVWAPTAVYLALTGAWPKALVLAGWGVVAIGLIDNLLYPVLVGNRLRFHPLPVFFSIAGGLWVFGAAGLVLGPLALAVTSALLDLLRRRTSAGRAADAAPADVAA